MRFSCFFLLRVCLAALCSVLVSPAAVLDSPAGRLTYVKVFKGSVPEYTRVTVEEDGEATYQGGSAEHPDAPERFRLSPATTSRLLGLTAELSYFQGVQLESGQRVANMGQKTFLYEKGETRTEASYNHTRNATANELQQWFERIARGRYLAQQLEHGLVFDRLGLLESLRLFEREYNAGQLVDPEQFIGLLERIASDARLMELARTRAQGLLRRVRGGAATLEFEYGDQESGWYFKMVLVDQGTATREARRFSDPANPQRLDLPETASRRLWELARLANYFRDLPGELDVGDRLRGYRITYEAGSEHRELTFLSPPDALLAEMTHLFQQVIAQEHFRQRLQSAAQERSFQLQIVLQELDAAILADKLIAPRDFVPQLEGIAKGEGEHPIVRGLAERLLAHIRQTLP